ncbi:hypothetical protein [Amorphus orientalis]|uniref:Uncharacterized protein n=1 Tax=Amorphus orientalis TaxID=649198 RepID=A0AAE3VQT8_9HYPH|nr:hypothetical protein [Amorphus orientalis]MDQ0316263.1 hypothetical protein [Amorphus orientalis]
MNRDRELVLFLVRHWLVGAAATVVVVAALFATDLAGIRGLVMESPNPVLPTVMLLFGFLVTLTSASMGAAIMSLGDTDRHPPQRPHRAPSGAIPALVPVVVRPRR